MRKQIISISILLFIFISGWAQNPNDSEQYPLEMQKVKQVLESYKTSINMADTTLASTFWLTTDQSSFIHPRSHEVGWENIKSGIYGMFGSRFTVRDLKSYNESFQLFGDMAVVTFYWIFDATYSGENPSDMQSRGRETMILRKFGGIWKIVHIHYSSMPVTGDRQGF